MGVFYEVLDFIEKKAMMKAEEEIRLMIVNGKEPTLDDYLKWKKLFLSAYISELKRKFAEVEE